MSAPVSSTPPPSRQMLEDEVRILRDGLKQGERIRTLYSQTLDRLRATIKARKQAEAHVQALFRAALNGILEVNEGHTIIFANPAAHQIFGWPAEGLIGQPFETLISPLEREALQTGLTSYFQTGASPLVGPVFEVVGLRADGTRMPCEGTLATVQGPSPTRTLLAIIQDISVRKREETDALRVAGIETIRQLLEGITHGVRNPLFILVGRIQLLESKLTQAEQQQFKVDLDKIQAAVQRMRATLDQLETFTTPRQLRPVPCSVALTVDEAAAFLADHFARGHITLQTTIATDLPNIMADPNQFRLVFLNLMLDAVERMREQGSGTLAVSAHRVRKNELSPPPILITTPGPTTQARDGVEIRIHHSGPAVPSIHATRLFEPFAPPADRRTGTGLELWSVRTIVMALRGAIHYELSPEQGHPTFVLQFPALIANE